MAILPHLGRQTPRVLSLAVDQIDPNPAQPRREFDPQGICSLADSIAENGLISPIAVRRAGERYQLIAGERRLMAFRLLGEKTIPAIVQQADDRQSAVLSLVENLQRRDLNFLEEAAAIAALIESEGFTQQQVADRLGMAQSTVANKLRLLRLPPRAAQALLKAGLTERHARALLLLAQDERLDRAVARIAKEQLNVAQTEQMVQQMLKNRPQKGGKLLILKDLRLFTSAISRAVEVMRQAGIEADSRKTEDERTITYTIVIPKEAVRRPPLSRDQTPPIRTVL
jgi:ParB family chromosome partitioning protein